MRLQWEAEIEVKAEIFTLTLVRGMSCEGNSAGGCVIYKW